MGFRINIFVNLNSKFFLELVIGSIIFIFNLIRYTFLLCIWGKNLFF